MHSSGFVYEGLWINGKPAVMATKIELCDTDASIGITISQGESFDIKIQTVNDEGEFIKGMMVYVVWEFSEIIPRLESYAMVLSNC